MRTGLIRRGVSLFVAAMMVSLVAAPAVSADANVAPTVTATVSNHNPREQQTVVASATFTDPESASETYTCSVDYGDGTAVAGVVEGMTCTGPAHLYAGNTEYMVVVSVTDSGGATGSGTTGAIYSNVAPLVGTPQLVGNAEVGQPVHFVATIADPGSATETYSCLIIYGDGGGEAGTYASTWGDRVPRCVGSDYVYRVAGTYTVTVQVSDGQAFSSSHLTQVIAPATAPQVTSQDVDIPSAYSAPIGSEDIGLGWFTDPAGVAAGPWQLTVYWGDGAVDTAAQAGQGWLHHVHAYSPGKYRARIVVTNAAGGSGEAYLTARVADDLVVTIPGPSASVTEGVPATFNVGLGDPYQSSLSLHMDWGDGTVQDFVTSAGSLNLTHTFSAAESSQPPMPATAYTIRATLTDDLGRTGSASLPIYVHNLAPVVVSASPTVPEAFNGLVTLASFTDGSAGPWTVLLWRGPNTHTTQLVQTPGPIVIPFNSSQGDSGYTVTVTDRGGLSSTVFADLVVTNVPPTVGHIVAGTPIGGEQYSVSASFSDPGSGVGYESYGCTVDYGDGAGPETAIVSGTTCEGPPHWYYGTGTYTITVSVEDGIAAGTATVDVSVANVAPAVRAYTIADWVAVGGDATAAVAFDDPGFWAVPPENYTCSIDYGDGLGPQDGVITDYICQGVQHAYGHWGTYTVTASVTDSYGGRGTYSQPVHVINPAPIVGAISATGAVLGSPMSASAVFEPTGYEPSNSCTVDYGDGTGPLAGNVTGYLCQGPSHTYDALGQFTVTIQITGAYGSSGSASRMISVLSAAPVVGAIVTPSPTAEGMAFAASASFTPSTLSQTYTCTVDYSDGTGPLPGVVTGSTCRGPKHTYGYSGSFTIWVVVKGSLGASGSASKLITVADVPPTITSMSLVSTAKIGSTVTATVTFTDPGFAEAYGANFDWGDGTQTTQHLAVGGRTFKFTHVYFKAGNYSPSVTIADSSPTTVSVGLNVYDPARTLSASGSAVSPKGACLLTRSCGVAGTAGFSISASYAKNATKPTVSLAYSVTGISITASSADYFVAVNGGALIHGNCSVNGKTGYNYSVWLVDGRPDTLSVFVYDANGNWIYFTDPAALKAGSITIK